MMKKPILIVGAGTGGHVFPAISLTETLLEKGENIFIVTDARAISYWPSSWKNIHILPITLLRMNLKGIYTFIISLMTSFIQSWNLLSRLKPSVIVAFGGYPTLPILSAAILWRCPIVLHEQNAVVGRINLLFSRFARCLAYSWPETRNLPSFSSLTLELTGLPVRSEIGNLHTRRYRPCAKENPLKVLVLGGSQGAQIFNKCIPEAISLLSSKFQKRLEIYHQCRAEIMMSVKDAYNKTKATVELKPFFEDIPKLLSSTHFIISRSGASTLGEISTTGLPALLVPYLQAKDDHQTANAVNLANKGAAWIIPQPYFTAERLKYFLQAAFEKPEVLLGTSEALNFLKNHQASEKLANLILALIVTQNKTKKRTKVL